MEYIMGYNVKKENYEKRCNSLVDMLMQATKNETPIKTTDIIVDTMDERVHEMRAEDFYMLFETMIEDVYIDDFCEHNLYSDWLYSYIPRVFEIATIEEFILECDGFLSYFAIYEIMDILKDKVEENSQIGTYINDEKFMRLENIYEEIIDVFNINLFKGLPSWAMYMDWNYDGYDSLDGKGTNWEELNDKYSIQDLINEIADDILEFDGCKEISANLKELKNSILPENTLKTEDAESISTKPSKNQMRIDLPQALLVLAEARTKEMTKLNGIFESDGKRIKDIMESGEALSDEEEEIKNNIIRTMEREAESREPVSKEISNVDDALNILGTVRGMEENVANEITKLFEEKSNEETKNELAIMALESFSREKALRKAYVEVTGSTELDYDNDGIMETESAIETLENWIKEPIETNDEGFKEFCHDRNKAIEIVLHEMKKYLIASKKESVGNEDKIDDYDPDVVIKFKDKEFENKIRSLCNITEETIRWKDIVFCEKLDFSFESSVIDFTEDVKWFLNLKELNLMFSKCKIDLESLKELTSLEYINVGISNKDVTGDLKNLKDLKSLKSLELISSQVEGSINSLSKLNSLEVVKLSRAEVSGDLSSLNKNTKLRELNLSGTGVLGNLNEINHMKALEELDLSESLILGDIKNLSNSPLLKSLDLSRTNILGDIKELSSLTLLKKLDLSTTKISGNIISLSDLTSLEYLTLSHTNITGDIKHLSNLTSLNMLNLENTQVLGDLTSLDHIDKLSKYLYVSNTDVYDPNIKLKYEVEDINNYISINWSDKADEILEIARKKLNIREKISVEENLDKHPNFEKYKIDILTEAASLHEIKGIEDFKKYAKKEFVSSKICNPREETFIIGTSADDLSLFISTYILVTNRGNRNIKKFDNEKPVSLDKVSNEEAFLAELNHESLRYKLQLLEINDQDWFGPAERGYQMGAILGYEKTISNFTKHFNIEKTHHFILEEHKSKNEMAESLEGSNNEFYESFFHGIAGEAYGVIEDIMKKYTMSIDDAIIILEDSLKKLIMLEKPIELESKYKEILYELQKEHIARNSEAKYSILLLINLYNAEKEYSEKSIDNAIKTLKEFAESPIPDCEDNFPRQVTNELYEIVREYSFSPLSDENVAIQVLLRDVKKG